MTPCNGCGYNMTCFIEREYRRMMLESGKRDIEHNIEDRHFYPQTWLHILKIIRFLNKRMRQLDNLRLPNGSGNILFLFVKFLAILTFSRDRNPSFLLNLITSFKSNRGFNISHIFYRSPFNRFFSIWQLSMEFSGAAISNVISPITPFSNTTPETLRRSICHSTLS
jgi:hypothetical protein